MDEPAPVPAGEGGDEIVSSSDIAVEPVVFALESVLPRFAESPERKVYRPG